MNELILEGIDGGNPLGFLAAMGTFCAANDIWPGEVSMRWISKAFYRPVIALPPEAFQSGANGLDEVRMAFAEALANGLNVPSPAIEPEEENQIEFFFKQYNHGRKAVESAERDIKTKARVFRKQGNEDGLKGHELKQWMDEQLKEFLEELEQKRLDVQSARKSWLQALRKVAPSEELCLGKTLSIQREEYRNAALTLMEKASLEKRRSIDLLAAFASETQEEKGRLKATPFCFVTGSGHQYFLDTVGKLMARVDASRIRDCLFSAWTFDDDRLSLRLAPVEDRRYALMWGDPGGQEVKTNWTANLLAYQGLRFYPVADEGSVFRAGGFSQSNGSHYFTWPVWDGFISLDSARSLLSAGAMAKADPEIREIKELRARGILEIYRCARIRVGNPPLDKINFSTPSPI